MSALCPLSGQLIFYPGTNELLVGAAVWVLNSGTTTPASVTQDLAGTTPHANPIIVGSDGRIPAIYWGQGTFRVRVTYSPTSSTPDFNNDTAVIDFDGIQGEIIVTGGGGGGGTTPPDEELMKTGDVKIRFEDGPLTGFVRANGRTIGSVASSATERANADTEALFLYGWNAWNDSDCPVVGGRGANAASDWAANKQLTLPNGRDAAIVGLTTMGNSAANLLQKSTTMNTTQASTSVVVASATGITRGMYVIATGIPAGTTVAAVSGTTITLSNAATANGTNVTVRFSVLRDAQLPAATGGGSSIQQNISEIAEHKHSIFDPGHNHGASGGSNDTSGSNFRRTNGNDAAIATNPSTTGIIINNTGSGNAMTIVQPSIGVSIYIKL